MRILLVHNYYLQPGGEDVVFESDTTLLRSKGHDVFEYIRHNRQTADMKPMSIAVNTLWSSTSYYEIKGIIRDLKPDIAQFYNFFPLVSPASYYACRESGVPVIQYLFNPRLLCPAASFYRDKKLCIDCVGKIPALPGIARGCYHGSRQHTFVVSAMVALHHLIGTWHKTVDFYFSATDFYRNLYIAGGLPADKIIVKPNYILRDPAEKTVNGDEEYALFIARLDPEKGVETLLKAWKSLSIPLMIRGNGQLESEMRNFVEENGMLNVKFVERLDEEQLIELRNNARFFVWTSEGYYETFGLAAVECFAQGIPVVASDIGVLSEIVTDGETGLLFKAGDADDLADKVRWMWERPSEAARMGRNARREYEEKYTLEKSYQQLMNIYHQALSGAK